MKKTCLFLILIAISIGVIAQNIAINTTGDPAEPTAILDISSQDKGFLIPRMTTAEREAILNPALGLLVFDTDTRSFWFNAPGWQEIISNLDMGTAGGDLAGQYPSPLVAKLQGHPVSSFTPNDKQVLKWDSTEFQWRGMNDSLTLPYSANAIDPNALFSITNTYFGLSPAVAIHGESVEPSGIPLISSSGVWGDANAGFGVLGTSNAQPGVFAKSQLHHGLQGESNSGNGYAGVYGAHGVSGITPGTTMGVWGNNAGGLGVVGTSNSGVGVYGLSFNNHGVYGYGTHIQWAGIKGSHANDGGIGVHGDVSNGTGVLGEVHIDGTGVIGKSTGDSGKAGAFFSTSDTHTDTTFVTASNGLGLLSAFHSTNESNTEAGIQVLHHGLGDGVEILLSNGNSNAKAVNAFVSGDGNAIYGRSEFGTAGKFEILNIGSTSPVLMVNNTGLGSGLDIASTQGIGANIVVSNPTATSRALSVTNHGLGVTSVFKSENSVSDSSVVRIEQTGQGHGLSILAANPNSGVTALSVLSAANWGIGATVFGKYAMHGFALADNGISVKGEAPGEYSIGVQGVANSPVGGKGVQGIGGYIGVYGKVTGTGGTAIYGLAGDNNNSTQAAFFENQYANNNYPVAYILTNGIGPALSMKGTNQSNGNAMFRISNAGYGSFLSLEDEDYTIKTSISKTGDIKTSGTLKVREDKGIVRNSTSTQLRVEVVSAVFDADAPYEVLSPAEDREVNVSFASAFTTAPVVYIANITQNGNANLMLASVQNVTTTGCTLYFINPMDYDIAIYDSTWKLVAMGQE